MRRYIGTLARRLMTTAALASAMLACDRHPTPHSDAVSGSDIRRSLGSIGSRLASFSLPALDGSAKNIAFPALGPTILVLVNETDCFTCANIQPDSWALEQWATTRHGRIIGIAASEHPEIIREYAKTRRLPFDFLIDSADWTSHHFGPAVHPMFAIVSPQGVVVAVLPRTLGVLSNPDYDPAIPKYVEALYETVASPVKPGGAGPPRR